jgi:hypothetical protein
MRQKARDLVKNELDKSMLKSTYKIDKSIYDKNPIDKKTHIYKSMDSQVKIFLL